MALEYWVEFKVFNDRDEEFITDVRTDTVLDIEKVLLLAGDIWVPFYEYAGEDDPTVKSLNIVIREVDEARSVNYFSEIFPMLEEGDEQQAIEYIRDIAAQL